MRAEKRLNGLRVLVTRPKPKGEILCEQIRAHGGEAIYFPTIEITPLKDGFEKELAQLQEYDWAIFVSPQAVYQIHSLPSNLKIAAIGKGTAQALQDKGFLIDACPQNEWNSEALLALPEFQNILNKKIAIIKGEGGRDLLNKELTARGAQVALIKVYQRTLPKVDVQPYLELLRSNAIDVIICTSNDGLQNLKTLLNPISVPVLVISERMMTRARDLGFKEILLAENPSHDAIIEALGLAKE